MIFRNDNSIIESLISIYTSNFIKNIEYKSTINFFERNTFYKNIIKDNKNAIINGHIPEIDYETTIVVHENSYIFDRLQDNNKKLLLFNLIDFDGKEYLVGERRKFF